jgi:hypothetical protein
MAPHRITLQIQSQERKTGILLLNDFQQTLLSDFQQSLTRYTSILSQQHKTGKRSLKIILRALPPLEPVRDSSRNE